MSSESLTSHLDGDANAALTEYAEKYDLSEREAIEELLRTGLRSHGQDGSQPPHDPDHRALEQRQRSIADQQQHIVRFQKYTVYGGLGWAVVTLATGANGSLWIALGMAVIVLMASSTFIWQYIPIFQ